SSVSCFTAYEIVSVFFFKQKTAYEVLRCLVGSEMCIRDRACAERCDGDEPLERECAGACRRFVEACRPLLPA
ncbi:four-helix bundle copper-binding protein, partial [Pseudomonas aeruginosa]|uniref:four-helix bundle copper-binding protein n=1 Tax=Pseudomonas aeruginosa TaxID=287 RepID=UPI001CA4E14D